MTRQCRCWRLPVSALPQCLVLLSKSSREAVGPDNLPEKAYLLIFFFTTDGASVTYTAVEGALPDILLDAPCRLGMNLERISEGFCHPKRGARSRVIRKYGSWSMAHGIRQRIKSSPSLPKIPRKAAGKAGAACVAGKDILPMLSESPKPKMPRA